jgi:hypothetical protein
MSGGPHSCSHDNELTVMEKQRASTTRIVSSQDNYHTYSVSCQVKILVNNWVSLLYASVSFLSYIFFRDDIYILFAY